MITTDRRHAVDEDHVSSRLPEDPHWWLNRHGPFCQNEKRTARVHFSLPFQSRFCNSDFLRRVILRFHNL
jgi:hypothetical protein